MRSRINFTLLFLSRLVSLACVLCISEVTFESAIMDMGKNIHYTEREKILLAQLVFDEKAIENLKKLGQQISTKKLKPGNEWQRNT